MCHIITCRLKTDSCILCSLFLSNLICFHAWLHFVTCFLSCFLSKHLVLSVTFYFSNLQCGTLPNASWKSKRIISEKSHLSVMSALSSKNSNRLFKHDLPWLKLFWPASMNYTLVCILLLTFMKIFSLKLMLNYMAYTFLAYLLRPFFLVMDLYLPLLSPQKSPPYLVNFKSIPFKESATPYLVLL